MPMILSTLLGVVVSPGLLSGLTSPNTPVGPVRYVVPAALHLAIRDIYDLIRWQPHPTKKPNKPPGLNGGEEGGPGQVYYPIPYRLCKEINFSFCGSHQ